MYILVITLVRLCIRLRLRLQSYTVGLRTDYRVTRARLTKQAGKTKKDFFYNHTAFKKENLYTNIN